MNSFQYYNPTRVIFGAGAITNVGEQTARWGKKALVLTTRSVTKRLGMFDRVKASLEKAGVESVDMFGVDPNPRLSTVYEGRALCLKEGVDIIVALGGGSVIDCAKAIAYAVYDDGDLWDFFIGQRVPPKGLPIVAVSTISGTGSEMNTNCVITNEKLDQKYSTHYVFSYPKAAIIDPELHVTVPPYLTACGMTDTISHVLEKYFDGTYDTPMQDRLSEGVTLTVFENEGVLKDPGNVAMRANLSWASVLALNGLNDAGRGGGYYDAHTIEMEISARYDVAHGAGLAVVHPAWMEYLCRRDPSKFAHFAKRVFGITGGAMEAGLSGIAALKQKFARWGMPTRLRDMNVPKEDLRMIAHAAVTSPEGAPLIEEDVVDMLMGCY